MTAQQRYITTTIPYVNARPHLGFALEPAPAATPRHRIGVERLWRQCAAAGDLCRKEYEGLYCVGCEQFYTEDELVDGQCATRSSP